MSEIDGSEGTPGSRGRDPATSGSQGGYTSPAPQVAFDRAELRVLFELYGRKVAEGEWRDYALDFLRERAVFSVYRRSAEFPFYRVEKTPKLARRQGAYAVIAQHGLILKRGHDLAQVIRVLDKPVRLVVG